MSSKQTYPKFIKKIKNWKNYDTGLKINKKKTHCTHKALVKTQKAYEDSTRY